MSVDFEVVTSASRLAQVLEDHASCDAVMVDTEFMRQDTFYPQIALVQLCFERRAYLVDPLAFEEQRELAALLADNSIVKVMHSVSEDLEVFQRAMQQQPWPLFDTQRAAAFLNLGFGLGYRALVEQICGIEIDKGATRSNWLKRPLTEEQLNYAALDVIPLRQVYENLAVRLQQQNKLQWLFEDCHEAITAAASESAPAHLRIKGATALTGEQLAVLIRLSHWREQRAIALDKPRSWILNDKLCIAIAMKAPQTHSALAALDGLPPAVLRKQADTLLELVSAGLAEHADSPQLPLPAPLSRSLQDQLKRVKRKGREVAAELDISPEALLPARDYDVLVRLADGQSVEQPARWSGWRQQVVMPALFTALEIQS